MHPEVSQGDLQRCCKVELNQPTGMSCLSLLLMAEEWDVENLLNNGDKLPFPQLVFARFLVAINSSSI